MQRPTEDLNQKNKQNISDGQYTFRQLYYIIEILKKQKRDLRKKLEDAKTKH